MKLIILAGLLAGLGASPARAQQESEAVYGGEIRYVDLQIRRSRGMVQEYDGKLYRYAHGDVFVSNQGSGGLFDISLRDIGSGEENGHIYFDRGAWFKGALKLDRMSHRQPMTDFVTVINGANVKIPDSLTENKIAADKNMLYKRTEHEVNLGFYDPKNSSRWLTLDHWYVLKRGDMPTGYYTGGRLRFKNGNIDNETSEVTVGLGRELGERGAASLDLVRLDFKDNAFVERFGNGTTAIRPQYPNVDVNSAELRWRFDPSKAVALTGAVTGRSRHNQFNLYRTNSGVAAFNAAYVPGKTGSLVARLYARYVEVDENPGYRNVLQATRAQSAHIDKLTARGELTGLYRPIAPLQLKAGYKMELTRRRDAPSTGYARAFYTDGTIVDTNQHNNSVANDVVEHVFTAGMKAELPLGAQLDGDYKRLQANRAAFVNSPTQADQADAMLLVPLFGRVDWTLIAGWLSERNAVQLTQYHHARNSYRTGLDWEASEGVFLGADGSYDVDRYNTEGWFGQSGGGSVAATGLEHVGGMFNRQTNTTTGLHGRVNLPAGFTVKGSGSYTWATVHTPLNYSPRTDPGFFLGDITPGDVRIIRSSVGLEYTPPSYKHLTARATYRHDEWADRYDPNNDGRAGYAEVGVSAKF